MTTILHKYLPYFVLNSLALNTDLSRISFVIQLVTLESVIDVGQGIRVGPGKFDKKNKRRALNKRRAEKI